MQCLIDRFFRDRLEIDFEKGKTVRRSGETELSSVAGFQNPFEIVRSKDAAPGINESTGDVSDHVVEKAFTGDVDPDEGPHFPKADLMDKPLGVGGDGVVPTEGSKVVAASIFARSSCLPVRQMVRTRKGEASRLSVNR